MPTGSAIVARIKNMEPIEGADRIVQAKIYGERVIVAKDGHNEGDLGVLFDIETKLSHEFCHNNNLYRHSELNKDKNESGYIEDNRRVRPIKLKGVRTSGFWMPIESLQWTVDDSKKDLDKPNEGDQFTEWNGEEICEKYVPKSNRNKTEGSSKNRGRSRESYVPTFREHFSTDQFSRNVDRIEEEDLVIITEKLHGTSGRCGLHQYHRHFSIWDFLKSFYSFLVHKSFPNNKPYKFVVGSRRVIKSIDEEDTGSNHYHDEDLWTQMSTQNFKGKLEKGETVYFEIVGYTSQASPIMGTHSNEKLKAFMDKKEYKAFIKKFGEQTVFSYGCTKPDLTSDPYSDGELKGDLTNSCKVFVYRITRQNEDGDPIDLSWEQVKRRCEKLGVDHVPELTRFLMKDLHLRSDGEGLETIVNTLTEEDSKNFPDHLNEGVCVRVENGSLTPLVLKSKRYFFRVLEGQIKQPSMEDEN